MRHATNTVAHAVTRPMSVSCRGVSASAPANAITPAIAVPACAGPPFRNARTWSRRASGTTFVKVSQPGEATPCSHTPVAARAVTSVTNPALTRSTPKEPTYNTGRTSTAVAIPNRAKIRFVASVDTRNAPAVVAAENTPMNAARSSACGYRSAAAPAHGRNRE